MQKILILGAGNIGSLIACLLAQSKRYQVILADIKKIDLAMANLQTVQLDVSDTQAVEKLIQVQQIKNVVSCLPYFCNPLILQLAKKLELNYFDLTEDVSVAAKAKALAQNAKNVFMPQCGLAPGFINIVANEIMQHFERLDDVQLRVGALPVNINNALHYNLSWSIDGLINEYGNISYGIVNGRRAELEPLDDLEAIEIDGLHYEAFNTSGGIATLVDTYADKVPNLNYKTIRYPGHCEKMRFLMKDLRLNEDRDTLKRILERALPRTTQDVALIYVAVTGIKEKQLMTETYVNKIYPQKIANKEWTAIQVTTASALCAVVDIVLNNLSHYQGLVLQEDIPLKEFLANQFGSVFENNSKEH